MSHTPGPWEYHEELMVVHASDCSPEIGHLFEAASDHPMAIANARLIAAAPQLLEALTELANEVEEMELVNTPDGHYLNPDSVVRARAAIAKAKGE
jgi:hypothetical protein